MDKLIIIKKGDAKIVRVNKHKSSFFIIATTNGLLIFKDYKIEQHVLLNLYIISAIITEKYIIAATIHNTIYIVDIDNYSIIDQFSLGYEAIRICDIKLIDNLLVIITWNSYGFTYHISLKQLNTFQTSRSFLSKKKKKKIQIFIYFNIT